MADFDGTDLSRGLSRPVGREKAINNFVQGVGDNKAPKANPCGHVSRLQVSVTFPYTISHPPSLAPAGPLERGLVLGAIGVRRPGWYLCAPAPRPPLGAPQRHSGPHCRCRCPLSTMARGIYLVESVMVQVKVAVTSDDLDWTIPNTQGGHPDGNIRQGHDM